MRLIVIGVMMVCLLRTAAAGPFAGPQNPAQRPHIRRAPAAAPATGTVNPADLSPTAPVVTLQGICAERKAKGPCETVVTREDLDRFVSGFGPEVSGNARGRLAVQYAGTLAFSSLSEKQGLQLNPALAKELEFQLKLVRMRVLASAFLQHLQQQNANVTEADIRKFYDEHHDQYEQVQARRLSIPLEAPNDTGRPLDRAAVKAEIESLRGRAVAGEDLNQLQQDAFKDLHIQATPPPVTATPQRRATLQGDEAKILDLNPGEISPVLDLPGAFAIVKIESKDSVPLQSVRAEIEAGLRQQRTQEAVRALTQNMSAQFNLPYLGLTSQPDIFALTSLAPSTTRIAARRPLRVRAGAETLR